MVNIDEAGYPENGQKFWTWDATRPARTDSRCSTTGHHAIGQCWKQSADRAQREVLKVAQRPPSRREAQNIAKRFRKHSAHHFRFLDTPGVEPPNNALEQRFRFVVIDRKITQGARGEAGRSWCERIWTVSRSVCVPRS